MSRSRPRKPRLGPETSRDIDALYGLEPVYEPDATSTAERREGTQFERVQCPYCGEQFETQLDLSAGSAQYVEDCQVCCQPIEMGVEIADDGSLVQLRARRGD
jgi:hypothetical protein